MRCKSRIYLLDDETKLLNSMFNNFMKHWISVCVTGNRQDDVRTPNGGTTFLQPYPQVRKDEEFMCKLTKHHFTSHFITRIIKVVNILYTLLRELLRKMLISTISPVNPVYP